MMPPSDASSSFSAPNLYLVGFMGTGKTTIGRAVAQRLKYRLLDSDYEIEKAMGKTIPEIFANPDEGEPFFRQLERNFIDEGHPPENCVVACGGGLVVQPGMLDLLKRKGVVVCLHASLETILKRTSANRNRPLLDVEDPMDRIRALYKEREPVYKRAGAVILTDHRPTSDIISHVMRVYRREVPDWLKKQAKAAGPHGG
ncbi:shikimate kinase [Actomonas aquatica]|uniref:Shikimate kinase n=1 Tax=Actomonas aquatica TaxID=2866162 RepID=A0ABZ1CA39_9BACT|nr:shikimate kinase [Opitutus sp. WL0086]WRQ88543.1 shikimate kinase [Opitutus sp. WL0086]